MASSAFGSATDVEVIHPVGTDQQQGLIKFDGIFGAAAGALHDGTPLTAEDVAATYRSVLDPQVGSPHRGSLHMLKRIEVVDADTVDFHLTVPDPLFPGRLVVGILPAPLLAAGMWFREVCDGQAQAVRLPQADQRSVNRSGGVWCDSARLSCARGGRRGGARLLTWSRILPMRSGSVISAITRSCPPQRGQRVMSISNTRFRRCAQVSGAVGGSAESVA